MLAHNYIMYVCVCMNIEVWNKAIDIMQEIYKFAYLPSFVF